jgi:superfamily II DNA or RNA helicase
MDEGPDEERLPDLEPGILYEGWGQEIREQLVEPALHRSTSYNRLTGFFTVNSLLAVADGVDNLWRRGGEMRLIVGIHDIPAEVLEVDQLDDAVVEEMVATVRERLLEEISTVEEEFRRDRLATLAWMMKDDLLDLRVACPTSIGGDEGIFHKKRLVFRDGADNTMVAVGSPNETSAGFRENIEELTVFRSWDEGQQVFVDEHVGSFEEIWEDERDYLEVVEIDSSFADAILENLDAPSEPETESMVRVNEIIDTAKASPAYSVLSFENVGLYPHQERVFVEALSRWPVRVLLADEVGLGKTLEAGAVLAYLLRFGDVEEATILAPANLLKQWQEELAHHFGLEFWRWDSGEQAFISSEGDSWGSPTGGSPVGPEAPAQVLISAQLARGTKKKGHIFEGTNRRPDVLLVDEAHAARVRPGVDGSPRPTRLWKTLDDITDEIPHIVFTTATPLQTNLKEYHALLELLGLPGIWQEFDSYEQSLELLADGTDAITLRSGQQLLSLLEATLNEMKYMPPNLSAGESELVDVARASQGSPGLDGANAVISDRESAYNLLVKLHPAHLLTLRNNQATLMERGYQFPERRFLSPELEIPTPVERFYDGLHEYLSEAYGQVEQAADPDREISLGFVKSSYHQRTASTLYSAMQTLENRKQKIDNIVEEGFDADSEILEDEYEEPDLDIEAEEDEQETDSEQESSEQRKLDRARIIESAYIEGLLSNLREITEKGELRDPKMEKMIELLDDHLPADGVLVFSRYTDTLDACLETFENQISGQLDIGYGMYTGQEAWITTGERRTEATKQDVKSALEDDDIKLVFCSEAAAEGLNLQAASVMINIDVPWNPAKLEQRIGRVARLGQSASEVLIYNLWYPDSVEAKMYTRLTDRKDLYDIAVGESPEIVSNAIRSQVASDRQGDSVNTEEAIEKLGNIRQSIQRKAMQKVWGTDTGTVPLSTRVRTELLQTIARHSPSASLEKDGDKKQVVVEKPDGNQIEACGEPEDRSILTLNHVLFDELRGMKGNLQPDEELLVVGDAMSEAPLALCVGREDSIAVVPPENLPALLDAVLSGDPLAQLFDDEDWVPKQSGNLQSEVQEKSRWLPNHDQMSVPGRTSTTGEEVQRGWSWSGDLAVWHL